MPKEREKKILTQRKVIKIPIYNLGGFIMSTKKMQSSQNNPENSYTEKKISQSTSL